MLDIIIQIQKWFKQHIVGIVPDGDYRIPINSVLYNVTILEEKIHLKAEVI